MMKNCTSCNQTIHLVQFNRECVYCAAHSVPTLQKRHFTRPSLTKRAGNMRTANNDSQICYYLLLAVIFVGAACGNYDDSSGDDGGSNTDANYDTDAAPDSMDIYGVTAADEKNHHRNYREPYDIFSCCKLAFGSCRSSCENLSLVNLATNFNGKDARIADVKRNCPSIEKNFWNCMNHTFRAIARGSAWSGRLCCSLAITPKCQNTCATSSHARETWSGCRRSDEQSLFECFARQEKGDDCCGNARTSECLQACRNIFQSPITATKEQRQLIEHVCNDNNTNSKVLNCVKQVIDLTPIDNSRQYLPCCGYSRSPMCRDTCKTVLETGETTQEVIDALENGGCGPPLPHEPLWQCFLSANRRIIQPNAADADVMSQINQIGMDSAKLHCCHKAVAPKCRRLCVQTFSNDWTESRSDFDTDCYEQLNEISLRQCLDEVDEPCELGCDGLSFCTNFNNRPTELFRSCHIQADYAAQSNIDVWKDNQSLSLPGLNLPIKDISKCEPTAWQAISCVLQLKPCARQKHVTQICREDCYDLLTKCMDWSRMETRHTAESICARFSVDVTPDACISLKPYMEASDLPTHSGAIDHRIVSPCRGHLCNVSEICTLPPNDITQFSSNFRSVSIHSAAAFDEKQPYQCRPGCPLGETSSYFVPIGSFVRVPVSLKHKGCFKACRCAAYGRLEGCTPLPCISYDSCQLSDRHIEHGSWFRVECNICSCFAGDITCTKKQCRIPGIPDHSYTSLPCNCPPHHVPVCGRNGYTYPSACVSKCAGLQDGDIEFGACRNTDVCRNVKCPAYTECVENRQICLSVMHKPCRQYQCVLVNATSNCRSSDRPVCGIDGQTYPSLCHMIKANATLEYYGRCLRNCKQSPVCGINGNTYKSECEAWSDFSVADYDGSCREIGLLTDTLGPRCASVKCTSIDHCHEGAIIPPGACCPVCGGAMRLIYSRKQIDRALFVLKGKNLELLTLKGILRALELLIRVSHCRLSGFLTIEADIFVLVHTTGDRISPIQHEACVREAEKIATLIDTQSHRITSDLSLSSLTVANVERMHDYELQSSGGRRMHQTTFIVTIVLFFVSFLT